jgi:hypothetical protein
MRYDAEREPVFVKIAPLSGGVVVVPAPRETTTITSSPIKRAVRESIRTVMIDRPAMSKSDVAALIDRRLDGYTSRLRGRDGARRGTHAAGPKVGGGVVPSPKATDDNHQLELATDTT